MQPLPRDPNEYPAQGLYDPITHSVVPGQAGPVQTDSTGEYYAPEIIETPFAALFTLSSLGRSSGQSADLSVATIAGIALDANITNYAGTNATIQFFIDRKGLDGVYYPLYSSTIESGSGVVNQYVSESIGPNLFIPRSLGFFIIFRWKVDGTSNPLVTFSASIQGK